MKTTFLFPGQGSQKVGMGADVYEKFASAREMFDEADRITGRDLKKICFNGPVEELTATQNTQPALFTIETVMCDLLMRHGIVPSLVLGHSLGEYSALYAAGVFSFADGLRIVAKRGELMAQAGKVSPGTMAAVIGLSSGDVEKVLATVGSGTVVAANKNSPDQTVISGGIEAVKEAGEKCTAAGAKRVVNLPVSGAFHSPLMKAAADEFEAFLKPIEFKRASCGIVTNVTAAPETEPGTLKELLVGQLMSPVRWVESMAHVAALQDNECIEVGPGNVLKGLARKCAPGMNVISCETTDNLYSLLQSQGRQVQEHD